MKPGKHNSIASPAEPIDGEYIGMLASFLENQEHRLAKPSSLTNTDLAFALNIPTQQLSALRTAESSAYVTDRRVQRSVPASASQRKHGQSLKCIRPYHSILIRLFLKYPEYGTIIPPRPSDAEVYEAIQPFMRPAGQPLNAPEKETRRWFAQLFGRSLITSYKMLPTDPNASAFRENSRPVTHLQLLIMLRFGEEFRKLYTMYRDRYLPINQQRNPLYAPFSRSWDILRERDSLTEWMSDELLDEFETELLERWRDWWDNQYLDTLRREAASRDMDLNDVLKSGAWGNDEDVTNVKGYKDKPITGADWSLLFMFRDLMGLSSSEFVWVLGISPKTYFMYRKRPTKRIEPAVSILMRHFYHHPKDLALFVDPPSKGADILETIQKIDPDFERKHLGVFFGGGAIAGYNMSRPDAMVPSFARRAATLLTRHLNFSTSIYWHLKECVEDEAKARGLNLATLWEEGTWQERPDSSDAEDGEDSDLES